MSVNGDASLISSVCSKTLVPNECSECFNSNPLSLRSNVRGLAFIAINCSYAEAIVVDELLTTYAKSDYGFCLEQFDYIVQTLALAEESWVNVRFQESRDRVEKAKTIFQNCIQSLNKPRYPDVLVVGLYKTKTSCDNAVGVLSQLIS